MEKRANQEKCVYSERLIAYAVGNAQSSTGTTLCRQEAMERLDQGEAVDLPKLALDLGYFDQAHFINDFKILVGASPREYAKRNR